MSYLGWFFSKNLPWVPFLKEFLDIQGLFGLFFGGQKLKRVFRDFLISNLNSLMNSSGAKKFQIFTENR